MTVGVRFARSWALRSLPKRFRERTHGRSSGRWSRRPWRARDNASTQRRASLGNRPFLRDAGSPRARLRRGSPHVADLDLEVGVELPPPELHRLDVLGMRRPRLLALFGGEFDDRHPLAVFRREALLRNVAGDRLGDFDDPGQQGDIFVARVGIYAMAEDGDDHRKPRLLRRPPHSIVNASAKPPLAT